jgi:methyltransferase (TIGR00027 family)
MLHGQPSLTAQRAAMRRALHQMIDTPRVLDDPLATRIIGPEAAAGLHADPAGFEGTQAAAALRAFLVVRSRLAEDELALAVARGVRQYVVLAAGLDTFAYRNPHATVRVFEVDHPATQAWKRARLADVGIAEPSSVTFVGADLAHDDLGDRLRIAGFDDRAPAIFAWLGTVPYLEPAAVTTTLRAIAAVAPAGGGVVFDYVTSPDALAPAQRTVWDAFAERVRAVGEPIRCFLDPPALIADLEAMGFRDVEDITGATLMARYFAGRTDGLRVGGLARMVKAMK